MPPPLGAGGIMFSGCPSVRLSVRSLKYPILTCTWVRWSTRPTVTALLHVRLSVCPSVRPERFQGICQRTHGGNGLKFYMLMYLDHFQNWFVGGHSLLIFLILALFWLSETGQIWGFWAFPGEGMEGMAWNIACLFILTFWFWCNFHLVKQVKFWVSMHFGHAMWIFLIMVTLWLKLVIFGVSGHYLENMWE